MEPNPVAPETSEETPDRNATQNRSYECNFCKRGFTNAQALGGHMNIHRKHKAKLKETSSSPPPTNAATAATVVAAAVSPFSISTQGKNKPLSLFGDGSSDSRNVRQENATKDDLAPLPEPEPEPESEVDLELRLGDKVTATRKFF